MSFKSREKKRKYRAAERAASISKAEHRGKHPDRWYLSIVKRENYCGDCAGQLRKGSDMVFRKEPTELLCVPCSQLRGIAPYMSFAVDLRERKRRGRRSRPPIADRSKAKS